MRPLICLIFFLLLGCYRTTPTEVDINIGPIVEPDSVLIDTVRPDKRCHDCWDSVAVLNQRILVLEDIIYHGGK